MRKAIALEAYTRDVLNTNTACAKLQRVSRALRSIMTWQTTHLLQEVEEYAKSDVYTKNDLVTDWYGCHLSVHSRKNGLLAQ